MLGWEPVSLGRSGDVVRRSPDGSAYAKTSDVADQFDRLRRLASVDFPAPRVLDLDASALSTTLTMSSSDEGGTATFAAGECGSLTASG
ncbi:hypothetical protein [Nocardioides sp.]|jgi:aminoglycoside phosphotransferase|uniref:hypothetical protein n=1 Tax=Nocardioides sp. TaxID=35761 RepID=UPI00262C0C35|nr:hypothetical protein [Nocardioides sp.]